MSREMRGGVRLCLIGPATETEFEDPQHVELVRKQLATTAPIGVLSLAAVLEQRGAAPIVVDLNLEYRDFLGRRSAEGSNEDFSCFAAERLCQLDVDVYGFSTICGSYPLTLRIAERVKQARPECLIMLGGPQATVVDVATLNGFPCVDMVVRGEAEESLPMILDALAVGGDLEQIRGVTFRRGSEVVRTPNAPVVRDLDSLPLPAFHLHQGGEDVRLALELGRGCPFACRFCSTNDFFRRNFRLKSAERVIEHMRVLRDKWGVKSFDLVHDMFTVDRKRVVRFCEALLATGEGFIWSCSARTDCIDHDLLDLMHKSGCRGIFFGIETGSARMQKIVNKNIDLEEARSIISYCDQKGIRATASLITGFPDEEMADVRDTAAMFVDLLRHDYVSPQLHLLSALGGTPLETEHREALFYDEIVSDMSYQGWEQDAADVQLIRKHRAVFPNFYAVPTPQLDRHYLKELRDFLLNGMERCHWLLVALHQAGGHIVDVFDGFLAWRRQRSTEVLSAAELTRYYARLQFLRDLFSYVRENYADPALPGGRTVAAVLEFEDARWTDAVELPQPAPGVGECLLDRPRMTPGLRLADLTSNFGEVIRTLRNREELDGHRAGRATVAARRSTEGRFEIIQLSASSAALIRLCDGHRTVEEITELFAEEDGGHSELPSSTVCRFGLQMLAEQGLVHAV